MSSEGWGKSEKPLPTKGKQCPYLPSKVAEERGELRGWGGQARHPPTRNPDYSQRPLPASAAAASDTFPFPVQLEVTPGTLPSALGDCLLAFSSKV